MTTTKRRVAVVLAVVGTVLAGIPLIAPLLIALVLVIAGGDARIDYLMPGELFVIALAGGVVLLAAALVSSLRRLLAGVTLLVAVASFAVTAAAAWPMPLVIAAYVLYVASVVAFVLVGALILRDLRHYGSGRATATIAS